jgi:hypothetical protein
MSPICLEAAFAIFCNIAAPGIGGSAPRGAHRLIAQTPFESIRLVDMCIIDWTGL